MGKLKELRKSKNLSQPELAELAGVSLKALQAYEQDYRPLGRASAEDVYRIAKALDTTIEELLGLDSLKRQGTPIIDRALYERMQAKVYEGRVKKADQYAPPLGYKTQDGKTVIDEEEAEVVKRAFEEMSKDGKVSAETEKDLREAWKKHYSRK